MWEQLMTRDSTMCMLDQDEVGNGEDVQLSYIDPDLPLQDEDLRYCCICDK